MPKKWLSCLMMSLLLLASVAMGCRAPYPTYNPYGFYGQPCVNPPGTGAYNPTGRTDPYYGAPANGVYPPNPYAPNQYPGYPPVQQPPTNTSNRTWNPQQTSTGKSLAPTVEPQGQDNGSLVTSTEGEWKSIENPNNDSGVRTASLNTNSSFSTGSSVPQNDIARFDGFGRN